MSEALAILSRIGDRGFVERRFAHYTEQPDQREAALRLRALWPGPRGTRSALPVYPPSADAFLTTPLSQGLVEAAPRGAIDFARPVEFLQWAAADWDRIPPLDFAGFTHVDIWVLVALGSLRLADRVRRPPLSSSPVGDAGGLPSFAHAVGFHALTARAPSSVTSLEPARTVKLTRVTQPRDIERAAA